MPRSSTRKIAPRGQSSVGRPIDTEEAPSTGRERAAAEAASETLAPVTVAGSPVWTAPLPSTFRVALSAGAAETEALRTMRRRMETKAKRGTHRPFMAQERECKRCAATVVRT